MLIFVYNGHWYLYWLIAVYLRILYQSNIIRVQHISMICISPKPKNHHFFSPQWLTCAIPSATCFGPCRLKSSSKVSGKFSCHPTRAPDWPGSSCGGARPFLVCKLMCFVFWMFSESSGNPWKRLCLGFPIGIISLFQPELVILFICAFLKGGDFQPMSLMLLPAHRPQGLLCWASKTQHGGRGQRRWVPKNIKKHSVLLKGTKGPLLHRALLLDP